MKFTDNDTKSPYKIVLLCVSRIIGKYLYPCLAAVSTPPLITQVENDILVNCY